MTHQEQWRRPVVPELVRRVPRGFGWVDHRLVQDRYVDKISPPAQALYLFLVTVADGQGMSWWGERSVRTRLQLSSAILREARQELYEASLVVYEAPRYQVLALDRRWPDAG
jgi:hypothetical protein